MPSNDTENIYATQYGGEGEPIPATKISYNNTTSGLTADDIQEAVDELADGVGTLEETVGDETGGLVKAVDDLEEKKFKFDTLWSGDASTAGTVVVEDLSNYDALMIYYNSGNGSGIIPYGFFKQHIIKVNYTEGTTVTSASATYVDDTHITLGASQGSTCYVLGIKFHA